MLVIKKIYIINKMKITHLGASTIIVEHKKKEFYLTLGWMME